MKKLFFEMMALTVVSTAILLAMYWYMYQFSPTYFWGSVVVWVVLFALSTAMQVKNYGSFKKYLHNTWWFWSDNTEESPQ